MVLPDSTNAASSQLDSSQSLSVSPSFVLYLFLCLSTSSVFSISLSCVFLSYFILLNSGVSPSGFVRSVTMAGPIDYLARPEPTKRRWDPGTISE